MSYLLKQSSTARPLLFLMIDSADHLSGKTGLSPTVTISKNGAAFASPAGTVSELGNGWYSVAGNATDTNTLGPLLLHATAASADPCDAWFEVVAFDPSDATRLGLTALPNANAAANGGLPTVDSANGVKISVGASTGQINASSGKVPATLASTDVTGNVACDVQTIKTQAVTCSAGVTVGAFVGNATHALVVDASGNASAVLANNADHGGNAATLTLGSSSGSALVVSSSASGFAAASFSSSQGPAVSAASSSGAGLQLVGTTYDLDLAGANVMHGSLTGSIGGGVAGPVGSVASPVTVGTNNDKTGYSLSVTPPTAAQIATALWQDVTSGSDFTTAGSIGKLLVTNIDATISSRSTYAGGAVASVTAAVTVGGFNAGAITDAAFTFPSETAGRPSTFLAAMRRVWEWVANKRTRDRSTGTVQLFGADNTTVIETQTQGTSGTVDSQSKGA